MKCEDCGGQGGFTLGDSGRTCRACGGTGRIDLEAYGDDFSTGYRACQRWNDFHNEAPKETPPGDGGLRDGAWRAGWNECRADMRDGW